MTLNEIANWILAAKLEGDGNVQITGLNNDSRSVQPGTLFSVCLAIRWMGMILQLQRPLMALQRLLWNASWMLRFHN